MGAPIVPLLDTMFGGGNRTFKFKVINVPSDFPTLIEANAGVWDIYVIGAAVTDNDPSKTNTGDSFIAQQELVWDKSTLKYYPLGNSALWVDFLSYLSPSAARDIDIQTSKTYKINGENIFTRSNPELGTIDKSVFGAINEINTKPSIIAATGLLTGGDISATLGTTVFSVASGTGQIYDVLTKTNTLVSWGDFNNISLIAPILSPVTYVAIRLVAGVPEVYQKPGVVFTEDEYREMIVIGLISHPTGVISVLSGCGANVLYNSDQSIMDIKCTFSGIAKKDRQIRYYPSGANLYLRRSASTTALVDGEILIPGGNRMVAGKEQIPDFSDIFAASQIPLIYVWLDNANQLQLEPPTISVDTSRYQDGGAVLATVPAGKFTVQWVVSYTQYAIIVYGTKVYDSYLVASRSMREQNLPNLLKLAAESLGAPRNYDSSLVTAQIIIKSGATDLTNTADAAIVNFDEGLDTEFVNNINAGIISPIQITLTGGLGFSYTSGAVFDEPNAQPVRTLAGSNTAFDNATTYLYWSQSGGGNILSVSASEPALPDVFVAELTSANGIIYDTNVKPQLTTREALLESGQRRINPSAAFTGMLLQAAPTPLNLQMLAGSYIRYGIKTVTANEIITSTNNMVKHYHSGGAWTTSLVAAVDPANYDNGTNLTAIAPTSSYKVDWFGYSRNNGTEKLHYFVGQKVYSTVALAIAGARSVETNFPFGLPAIAYTCARLCAIVIKASDTVLPSGGIGTSDQWIDLRTAGASSGGASIETYWNRVDLGGGIYSLTPKTSGDRMRITDGTNRVDIQPTGIDYSVYTGSGASFRERAYNGATLDNEVIFGADQANHAITRLYTTNSTAGYSYLDINLFNNNSYLYIGRLTNPRNPTSYSNQYIYNYHLQRNIRFAAAGANANMLETWCENDYATGTDITGTSSSIALYQRKPELSMYAIGQLTWTCEGSFIGDPALSHHAGFRAYVLSGGSLVPAFYVDKNQNGTLYNIWSYNSAPTFTPGSDQIPTVKYVDDAIGGINYWDRIDLGGSVFAVLPKTTTDKVMSHASFYDRAYNGATLDNELILGADPASHAITRLHTTNSTSSFTYLDVNLFNNNSYLYIGRLTNPSNTPTYLSQYIYNYHLQRNIRFAGIGANANMLETWCENDYAVGTDITGTSSSIALFQRKPELSMYALGKITWTCEGTFIGDPALSHHAGFRAYVLRGNNLYAGIYIDKDQNVNLYNNLVNANDFVSTAGSYYLGTPNNNTIGSWKQYKSGTGVNTTYKLAHYEDASGYTYVDKFSVDYLGNVVVSNVSGQSLFELTKDVSSTLLKIDSRDNNKQSMVALRKNGVDSWFITARNNLDTPNNRLAFIHYTGSSYSEDAYFSSTNGDFVLNRSLSLKENSSSITPGSGFGTISINLSGDLLYTVNHLGTTKSKILAQFSLM